MPVKVKHQRGTVRPPNFTKPEINRFCKGLIFAPSGHGKTHLLGTAQDDERTFPMIVLDYEGGTSTLVGRDIDIVRIRDWQDYNESYAYLKNANHPYNSVGLDSISESHIFALLTQLDSGTRDRRIPDLLEQGDYGVALVQMRRLLRAYRDLPLHFFATCMAKDDLDPREGMVKKPALAGALADEAPGIFEMVAYLALSEVQDENGEPMVQRFLVLKNYPKLRTKVRVPQNMEAPDYILEPTITTILDTLGVTAVPRLLRAETPQPEPETDPDPKGESEPGTEEGEPQEEESPKPTPRSSTRRVITKAK
jgi:hypothetical protein